MPLTILKELQERVKFAEKFCEKTPEVDINTKNELISIQNDIKELSLKISVKEIIIRNMDNRLDFNIRGEKERLEKILEDYQQCKSNDTKDLIEFEKIIKDSFVKISEDEKKATNFLQNFNRLKEDNHEKFMLIFEKYNVTEYYESEALIELLDLDQRYDTIVKLCGIYQQYNNNLTPGAKKDAFTQIQIYLNHLKTKCEDKTKPLFSTITNK